jgi:hypothetical protein
MVDAQVLTPLDARSIIGTEPDQDSIMCYQLPGEITKDGLPIRGGTDINPSDCSFAGLIYPKILSAPGDADVVDVAGARFRTPAPRSAPGGGGLGPGGRRDDGVNSGTEGHAGG